ncbi:MAG: hypothetical protein JNM84_08105 [Planctomycetes bacterium]|nr:hypothetical protein [Planctomycetota bacterium]
MEASFAEVEARAGIAAGNAWRRCSRGGSTADAVLYEQALPKLAHGLWWREGFVAEHFLLE